MGLKKVRQNKYIRFFTNRYVLISIVFLVWMIFFDENSFLVDHQFNKEIKELETDKKFYQSEINKDKQKIEQLEDSTKLDTYAREVYHMKKENEDVFIIEYDSIKE
ncbi:hypothetical protein KH5_03790 [Urechidicola sp. KH5]